MNLFLRKNIEGGLLYACTKGKKSPCSKCREYEECRGDKGSGIYGDRNDLNMLFYAFCKPV